MPSLTSIILPNSLKVIGGNFCYQDYALTTVTVGSGVTSVGSGAFQYCNAITTYNFYPSTAPTTGTYSFPARGSSAILHVPASTSSYTTTPWTNSTYFAQPITKDL